MPAKIIPVMLTEKDWTKKKGLVAKAAVKTGVTDAIKKFETAFKKVKWDDLDPKTAVQNAGKKQTGDMLKQLWRDAQPEWGKVQSVANALLGVESAANAAEGKYKAAKIHIPDSSKKHAKAVAAEAKRFSAELLKIDDEWTAYMKPFIEKDTRDLKEALEGIKKYPGQLREFAKELDKTPTVVLFVGSATKGFFQNIRGMNAALRNSQDPIFLQWAKTNWTPMAQDGWKPKKDEEVPGKVKAVLDKLEDLEQVIKSRG